MKPLVIKLGGALLDEPKANRPFFAALAELITQGRPLVVVHGGGVIVDRHLERLGLKSGKRDGIRITPPEHMDEIVSVLAGQMNAKLVGLLRACGVNAVGLTLADGGTTLSRLTRKYDFDAGRVGEITGGDPHLVQTLLRIGCTPVFSSIAMDDAGGLLNVNADEAAAAIAKLVTAEQLVLLTDVPGVKDGAGNIIRSLDRAAVDRLTKSGEITGGMLAKVRSALEASEQSRIPTLVTGWDDAKVLGALGTESAAGTLFLPALEACNV
ncbi:MAG: acetylglutamate kinase [Planctomycetes bacterium]|nr:acetylglutamate kinase [Planctomycetota bacterium]